MPVTYIARKKLLIGSTVAMPGDDVTAAATTWRNLHSYLAAASVVAVQTDIAQSVSMNQAIPLAPKQYPWQEKPHHLHDRDSLAGWFEQGQKPQPMMLKVQFGVTGDEPSKRAVATVNNVPPDQDTVSIDWGDGSDPDSAEVTDGSATAEHDYADAGEVTVTAEAGDETATEDVEVPDDGGGGAPALTLTFPTQVGANNGTAVDFDTSLSNTGGAADDCTGKWTLTLPTDCTVTATDLTVNMVGFNGPGQDVLIDFEQVDATTIVGTYGPFPVAAGMDGSTTDQLVIDSDWLGAIEVKAETLDSSDASLASATFTLNVNNIQ